MATRKQTPDVLGAVLAGPAPVAAPPAQDKTVSQPKTPRARRSPRRKTEARTPSPQQWQYVVITFYDYGGWKPRFQDGKELSGWKTLPDMPDYIKLLGESGWELAGTSNGRRRELIAFFKRPKKAN